MKSIGITDLYFCVVFLVRIIVFDHMFDNLRSTDVAYATMTSTSTPRSLSRWVVCANRRRWIVTERGCLFLLHDSLAH